MEQRELFRPSIMNAVCWHWQMMDLLAAKSSGTANPSARKLWELLEKWEQSSALTAHIMYTITTKPTIQHWATYELPLTVVYRIDLSES